jgi:hypothetical protein
MAHQYGVILRTAQVAQIQASIGAAGILRIFSGAEPANCAAADPVVLLATINLPAVFLNSANGATTLAGVWQTAGGGAVAAGTAQSYRMYDSGLICHVQGNTTADLVLNNQNIAVGQQVSVTSYAVTAGNA